MIAFLTHPELGCKSVQISLWQTNVLLRPVRNKKNKLLAILDTGPKFYNVKIWYLITHMQFFEIISTGEPVP